MSSRVPVVSLLDYRSGSSVERERFVRSFGEGLKELGFVTVEHHGVDLALIRRAYEVTERFFALPEPTKRAYHRVELMGQRGYVPFGTEHAKNRTVGDLKEFWHVGRELPPGHRRLADYGHNLWPAEIDAFRQTTLELFTALDAAAAELLRALAEFFGVERNTFSDLIVDGNSILRLIHYPPLRDQFVPGAVRAAEHEDINLITLLCEGTSSGLEILTRDGQWLPVDTLRGQIVVDSGDMLSRITNNVIPSTTHRVVNPEGQDVERYSMPFFVHPFPECVLKVLPQTERADQPSPAPITADAFLRQRLKEIGLLKA